MPEVSAAAEGAWSWLLNDHQVRAARTVERSTHRAWKPLNTSGLETVSDVELSWNPAYEQVVLHGVWVSRNGQRQSVWRPDDAHVLQRETNLDQPPAVPKRCTT